MTLALSGARVFDGARFLDGYSVVLEGAKVSAVLSDGILPAGIPRRRITGLIAPGFIDVQVNGGGGVLFNDERSIGGIVTIGAAHRLFGTTGFLPTFITDTREHMGEAIAAARSAIAAKVPGVLGIHLEGPFISHERNGVHEERFIRSVEAEDVALITAGIGGTTLVTLAPEVVPQETIRRLAQAGIVVAAGHTVADTVTIAMARAAGLRGFTHLFNAMPPLSNRAPGPVGAALDDAESWASLIVDLHHVAAPTLRIALAAKGWKRMLLVTDAMPTVGSEMKSFQLLGHKVTLAGGRLTSEDGTIAGSNLDMATAVRNTVKAIGLPLEAALHMASRAPAEFLGLGARLGRIAPGYTASLVNLDDDLRVTETWIDGVSLSDQLR